MNCLVFDMGRPAIPQETSLFSLLAQCFVRFKAAFELDDAQGILSSPSRLERILCSIFDTASRAFVTDTSSRALAELDEHDKACLFVQAVAGMAMIFQRLSCVGRELSSNIFLRELQLFAESDQRQSMLDKIDASSLISSCYTTSVMVDFVMAVIEGRDTEHFEGLSLGKRGQDLLSDHIAWVSDRPCKNMGLPWGFTIMALN